MGGPWLKCVPAFTPAEQEWKFFARMRVGVSPQLARKLQGGGPLFRAADGLEAPQRSVGVSRPGASEMGFHLELKGGFIMCPGGGRLDGRSPVGERKVTWRSSRFANESTL